MLLLLLSFVFSAAQFLEGGLPAMPEVPEKWERCKDAIPVLPGTIYSQWVKHRKSYSECAWQKFKSMFDFVDSRLRQQKFPCTVTVKQVAKRDDKDTVKTKIEELPPDPVEVNRNILFTKLFCAMVQDENCILQDKEEFGSNDITAYKFFIDADRNGGTNLFLDTSIPKSFLEILFSRNHLDGLCVVSEALTARDRMLTLYQYNQRLMRVNDDIKGFDRLAYSLFAQIVISPPKYLSPSFLPVEHIQEIETFCDDSYESKVRVGAYLLCLSLPYYAPDLSCLEPRSFWESGDQHEQPDMLKSCERHMDFAGCKSDLMHQTLHRYERGDLGVIYGMSGLNEAEFKEACSFLQSMMAQKLDSIVYRVFLRVYNL